jgi:hypothetical protein
MRWTGRGAAGFLLVLAFYFTATVSARSHYPWVWVDEGWLAEVGWTKAHAGVLGNPSHGNLYQYDARVYWMPPLYFLGLSGAYAIFSDPLEGGRNLSLLTGGLALLVLGWIGGRLVSPESGDRSQIAWLAWLTLAFTLDPMLWKVHRSIRFEAMTGLFLLAATGTAALARGRLAWAGSAFFSALAALVHPTGMLALPASLGIWIARRPRTSRPWLPLLGTGAVFFLVLLPYLLYLARDRAFGFANLLGQNAPHLSGPASHVPGLWIEEWKRYRNYFSWPRLLVPGVLWGVTLFLAIRRRAPGWLLWTIAILVGGFACLPNKTELYLTLVAPFLYLSAVWTGSRMGARKGVWAVALIWLVMLASADAALLARNRDCRYRSWAEPLSAAVPARASVAGTFVTWFAFHEHPYFEFHRQRAGDLALARPELVVWGDAHMRDPMFARLREELGPFLAAHADTLARSGSGCYGDAVLLRPRWNELDPQISRSWERFGKGEGAS